jgi:hypothetical protein
MKILKCFEEFTEEYAKKLEIEHKTYLKRLDKNVIEYPEDYQNIITLIKFYDISNFTYNNKPYYFWIKPDQNFIDLIKQLNNYISVKISENITFDFTYDVYNLNRIEFKQGIPVLFKQLGLGYKLYLFVIEKIKFAISDRYASKEAIHVWRGLITNDKYYSFTSNKITGIILKNQSDIEIKRILDDIKNYNSNVIDFEFKDLIFDDKLEEKITEIYGNVDNYKQNN